MIRRRQPALSRRYGPSPVRANGDTSAAEPRASPVGSPVSDATPVRSHGSRRRVVQAATSIWRDPYHLALAGLVIDSTSHVTSYYLPLAKLRPGLVLFCLSILFALTRRSKSIDLNVFRRRMPKLMVLQCFLVCGSALFGISLGNSAHTILDSYSKMLVMTLLLMSSLRSIADVRRAVWALAIGGVVLAFLSIFVVHLSKEVG